MPDPNRRLRVLLADQHTFFLETFALLVERRYELAGMVTDGRDLLAAARVRRPDLIVLDIALPSLGGLEAAPLLKEILPDVRLIFLTSYEDPQFVRKALRAGASAYLLKTSSTSELFDAVGEALAGRVYVTPPLLQGMVRSLADDPDRTRDTDTLTLRQQEVLKLLAQGQTMKEAASSLHLSPRTVADHKYRIMDKLGVDTTAELMQYAIRRGILPS